MVIGDLNGDVKSDLAATSYYSDAVSVLRGNGDGTFAPKNDYATGSEPQSVAIGDLNGDGKPDLATANHGSTSVAVLLGNGNGTFGPNCVYPTGRFPQSIAIGDLRVLSTFRGAPRLS